MSISITNPNFEKILNEHDLSFENANFFEHAYYSDSDYDPASCLSYFADGLNLKHGYKSFLATMLPFEKRYDLSSQMESLSARGDHKLIICIPHQLEDMFFGDVVTASGDSGNQYEKHIFLDYFISYKNKNILPPEFIMGMYFTGSDERPPEFYENPFFFKNKGMSEYNTENLKSRLLEILNKEDTFPARDLLLYCLGEKDMSQEQIDRMFDLFEKYSMSADYQILKQTIQQKQKSESEPNPSGFGS